MDARWINGCEEPKGFDFSHLVRYPIMQTFQVVFLVTLLIL